MENNKIMYPQNTIKLMHDYEHIKIIQDEIPSKFQAWFMAAMQFIMGVGLLTFILLSLDELFIQGFLFFLLIISFGLIIFSAYTLFGHLIRKRYLLLIESIIINNRNRATIED